MAVGKRRKVPLEPGTRYIDLVRQGIPAGTASRAVARGYLWVGYHTRTYAHDGEDRLSECLGADGVYLLNYVVAVARHVIARYGMEQHTVGSLDPGTTEFEDLIQMGALRCLELRSHPDGCKKWYGAVIANEVKATLNRAIGKNEWIDRWIDQEEIEKNEKRGMGSTEDPSRSPP